MKEVVQGSNTVIPISAAKQYYEHEIVGIGDLLKDNAHFGPEYFFVATG